MGGCAKRWVYPSFNYAMMKNKKIMKGTEEKLKEKINSVLKSMKMGFSLQRLEIDANNGSKLLRIFVDKPGGITIDDCANISEKISIHLGVCDFISETYRIEVSSPGIGKKVV
jgi:ribosome maturation factor RimP